MEAMGRRTVQRVLALATAAAAFAFPSPASADYIAVSQKLADRHLRPAPLLPTTAPRSLQTLDATMELSSTRRRSAYAIAMRNAYRSNTIDTVIFLEGGEYKSLRAALHAFRGSRAHSTRVRGRRAYLISAQGVRTLFWSEGGRVYEMGSGTPRTVSLKELRATAEALDPLVGGFSGSVESTSESGVFSSHEAFVAVTRHTVSADVDWSADCVTPDGRPGTQRAGRARAALQPRRGDEFSFDIAPFAVRGSPPVPWQGTVSGTVGASGGTLNMRATAVAEGETCDSGPVTLTLRPGDRGS
jgi:hypothetical protein